MMTREERHANRLASVAHLESLPKPLSLSNYAWLAALKQYLDAESQLMEVEKGIHTTENRPDK